MRGFESLRMQRRLADWRADSRLRDLTWRSRSETESVCELLPATRLRLALSTLLFAESLAAMCRDDLESSEVDGWVRAVAMVGTECAVRCTRCRQSSTRSPSQCRTISCCCAFGSRQLAHCACGLHARRTSRQ
jgi:hypothetical protein